MAFPERVTVRLSSDEAGGITLTPVVAKQMRPAELIDLMLPLTGKDAARLRELLARGNWVEGGSRFRWAGFEVGEPEMARALEAFPDSDPNRPFDEARCDRVHLIGPRGELVVRKATAARPRLLKKESFWDSAMASITATRYTAYDYREKADRYEIDFPAGAITGAAGLLFDAALRRAVQASRFERAVAFVNR